MINNSIKIKKNIDKSINTLKKYKKQPKEYIINNNLDKEIKSFNYSTYNNKYSRKIVKNYVNNSKIMNQKYFNYIVGGTINLCKKLLGEESSIIKIKLKNICLLNKRLNNLRNNLKRTEILSISKFYIKMFKNPNFSLDHNHLLYIFFYVIPRIRRFIQMHNEGHTKESEYYGTISKFSDLINITHPFNMLRFNNYNRLKIILEKVLEKKNTENFSQENIEDFSERDLNYIAKYGFYNEIISRYYYPKKNIYNNSNKYKEECFPVKNLNTNKIKYITYIIKLDIPEDFFNYNDIFGKYLINIYNKLKNITNMKIKFYTYDGTVKRLVYGIENPNKDLCYSCGGISAFYNFIGSNSKLYKNVNRLLLILSYCLSLLKNKTIRDTIFLRIENDMDKIKKIIIIFYYLFIYLMIFELGTASIAEISLFTLWDTYVNFDGNEPLILNENTMLDVEVLSSQFSKFYTNCFNQEFKGDIYTPYFISSVKKPVNNPLNTSVKKPVNNPLNTSVKKSVNNSLNTSVKKSVNNSLNTLVNTPLKKSVNTSVKKSVNNPLNTLVNTPLKKSVNTSVKKPVNTSVKKSVNNQENNQDNQENNQDNQENNQYNQENNLVKKPNK